MIALSRDLAAEAWDDDERSTLDPSTPCHRCGHTIEDHDHTDMDMVMRGGRAVPDTVAAGCLLCGCRDFEEGRP